MAAETDAPRPVPSTHPDVDEVGHQAVGGRLSIGALSRATGIPTETLRTWEARYGFPVPERRPSGHRVYSASLVDRLRLITEALARGHRASEAVPATDAQIRAMLEACPSIRPGELPDIGDAELEPAIAAVVAFDADTLTRTLLADAARFTLIDFLDRRVAPLVRLVGEAWSRGTLHIRHEHFLSERLGDVLRTLRLRHEDTAKGPPVLFVTPPGEAHALGLQMAALVVASAGCRVVYLGTEVPAEEVGALARDTGARAVAVSFSILSSGDAAARYLDALRGHLPRLTELLAGGEGSPTVNGSAPRVASFATLLEWARRIAV